MYIYGAVRSVYGPTDGYSTRAHPPPLAEARLGSRSTSARSGSPIYASVPPHARVYARRYARWKRERTYTNTTNRAVHQGTKPKAINLFARQPATRHCVYPHVNHYVRLRDIEADTRPVSQRISNSPFPPVGQNAWISIAAYRDGREPRLEGARHENDWTSRSSTDFSATRVWVIEFTGCARGTNDAIWRLWNLRSASYVARLHWKRGWRIYEPG